MPEACVSHAPARPSVDVALENHDVDAGHHRAIVRHRTCPPHALSHDRSFGMGANFSHIPHPSDGRSPTRRHRASRDARAQNVREKARIIVELLNSNEQLTAERDKARKVELLNEKAKATEELETVLVQLSNDPEMKQIQDEQVKACNLVMDEKTGLRPDGNTCHACWQAVYHEGGYGGHHAVVGPDAAPFSECARTYLGKPYSPFVATAYMKLDYLEKSRAAGNR